MPDAWERLEDESPRAFAAFAAYRDMGPERTLGKVARQFDLNDKTVDSYSARHRWVGRAAAWDAEIDRTKRFATLAEHEAMARRQVLAGQLFMSKGIKRIQLMDDDEIAQLTPWEAIRLAESGMRMERQGHGERPDAPAQIDVTVSVGRDAPLLELMDQNPGKVGRLVEALVTIRDLMPEPEMKNVTPDEEPEDGAE